ncbi:hypothetical protein EJB05_44861, partial [Eragrostis curvula]
MARLVAITGGKANRDVYELRSGTSIGGDQNLEAAKWNDDEQEGKKPHSKLINLARANAIVSLASSQGLCATHTLTPLFGGSSSKCSPSRLRMEMAAFMSDGPAVGIDLDTTTLAAWFTDTERLFRPRSPTPSSGGCRKKKEKEIKPNYPNQASPISQALAHPHRSHLPHLTFRLRIGVEMAAAMKSDGPAVGIDLGTTYSCMVVWRNNHGEVHPQRPGQPPHTVLHRVHQLERLVGEAAENQAGLNPINTIFDQY